MKKRVSEMQDEITRLQGQQDLLGDRLAGLEAQLRAQGAPAAPRPQADNAPIERPRLKVIRLSPDDPSGAARPSEAAPSDAASQDQEDQESRPVIRVQGRRMMKIENDGDGPTSSAADVAPAALRRYRAALDLVRSGQYEEAVAALGDFLARHGGHPHADNALYWRGECFYARGQYSLASADFAAVLERYPHGNKVPDALLKLGMSQARLGRSDRARAAFAELSQTYPTTDAARRIPAVSVR